jgi:hypothetical protein
LEAELKGVLGGWASSGKPEAKSPVIKSPKKKRTMSPEARARIAAAQKARWAKSKGQKTASEANSASSAPTPKAAKKKVKRVYSPEALARMAAGAKKRWANAKKA